MPNRATVVEMSRRSHIVTVPSLPLTTTTIHHHYARLPLPPSSAPVNAHIWATPGQAHRHAHDPRLPRHEQQPADTFLPPWPPYLDNDNHHVTAPFDPQHHHITTDKGHFGSFMKLCDFTLLFMTLQVELRLNKKRIISETQASWSSEHVRTSLMMNCVHQRDLLTA